MVAVSKISMDQVKSANMPSASTKLQWLMAILAVVILDQATKSWASEQLIYAQPNYVFWWLDITLHHNTGAAFSFLSDAGGWQRYFFSIVASVVSIAIIVWLSRLKAYEMRLGWALVLVLAGAMGNLIDRVTLGYVVDFISVHWDNWYFPTFNVADSSITIGAILLLIDSFLTPSTQSED